MKLYLQNCATNSRFCQARGFYIVVLLISCSFCANAQTLFTYGKHKVSKDEFLRAYNKNNSDTSANRMSYNDYLELYTRFRLKVQAARDAGLDTTAQQKNEVQSFRYQLAENFLKEDASIDILINEAVERSLKDIHVSHIFIPLPSSAPADSLNIVKEKINDAYERLQNGETFEKVAAAYQHGSIGYITAFVLPYDAESKIYATLPGKHSVPFRTSSGFHIVRNDGERKAAGKIRAAQILLAFPPEATHSIEELIAQRADSVYKALVAGSDFAEVAGELSDDHLSFQTRGEMPAFGVGQYDTIFEKTAFGLQKDGDFSMPVKTAFGYHIIKRLQRIPVIEDPNNKEWKEVIRERVLQSDRMEVAQARLIQNIRQIISKDAPSSALSNDSAALDYYRNNLEKYNQEFAEQLKEFTEGNLLFTIMQQKVWDAAAEDTAGLIAYYEQHKQKYNWEASADALIITSLIPDSVASIQQQIKNDLAGWQQTIEKSNGIYQADSGRFELSQIPVVGRTNFTEGLVTAPVVNEQDSSMTFAYIIKLHNSREPKSFADAKGAVINDYQVYLEEKWIAELKKKYAVKVNKRAVPK